MTILGEKVCGKEYNQCTDAKVRLNHCICNALCVYSGSMCSGASSMENQRC